MNIKAINGNNYDDFLDGFFGGGEYGVSRNGSIGIDKTGNVFARKGVSETDKELVSLKHKASVDPNNSNIYKEQAANLRKQNPSFTVRPEAPLSEFEILDNPRKELNASGVSKLPYTPGTAEIQKLPHSGGTPQITYLSNKNTSDVDKIREIYNSGGFDISKAIRQEVLRGNSILNTSPKETSPSTTPSQVSPTSEPKKQQPQQEVITGKFESAPTWFSPAEETDDEIINAGREHGTNILEKHFNRGYIEGADKITDYLSPIGSSTYLNVARANANDHAKAEFAAGVGASISPILNSVYNSVEKYQMFPKTSQPFVDGLTLLGSAILGTAETILDDNLQGAKTTYNHLNDNNRRAAQSDIQYEYLKNSDYKYLVNNSRARKEFIKILNNEIDMLENTERLGYLPDGINEKYKQEVINTLRRIIHINVNYNHYKAELDSALNALLITD